LLPEPGRGSWQTIKNSTYIQPYPNGFEVVAG
jgi:hypothetical protein